MLANPYKRYLILFRKGDEMERVCVFCSVYGSRGVSELWKMYSSDNYSPVFYVVAKQNNPMVRRLVELSEGVLRVDRSLSLATHLDLLEDHRDEIDLAVCPHEKPVMAGLRDEMEERGMGIPTTFPTGTFALERSKILQRKLFPEDFNPRWRAFNPSEYESRLDLESDVKEWVEELGGAERSVFKPDSPTAGKGVAVGGEHFQSFPQLMGQYVAGFGEPFIIEEKVDAEESSCQIWYDGNIGHTERLRYPETRDYKRAFEDDEGPNTGGMGCYMDRRMQLPFMVEGDWEAGLDLTKKTIRNTEKWADEEGYDTSGMSPSMYYLAMAHPHKVFEGNIGRPGDPEDIPAILTMKNDLIDFYLGLVEGNPPRLEFEEKAAILVYVVPPTYGGKTQTEADIIIDFGELEDPEQRNPIYYPGDVEIGGDGKMHVRSSRSVAVVAKAETIEEARVTAHKGADALERSSSPRGMLWHRKDIASRTHIKQSIKHRKRLRSRENNP